MSSHRKKRVADLILREVASLLQKEVKDPRIGLVTLTSAEVTPDMKIVKIFYTVMGDDEQRKLTKEGLEKAKTFIRKEVGQRMALRSTPEIRFIFDSTMESGLRIEWLLDQVKHGPTSQD